MLIAFLLPANIIGGGVFCVYEHAKRLAAKGHKVWIFFPDHETRLSTPEFGDLGTVQIGRLADAQAAGVFDFAFATAWQTAFAVHRIPARHYCYIVQDDERNFYDSPWLAARLLVEKTYAEQFHFFATSPWLAGTLKEGFGKEATVIPYSIPFERFENPTAVALRSDRLRVLVEGRGGEPRKRLDLTFKALSQVSDIEVFHVSSDGNVRPDWRMDRYFEKVPYEQMPGIFAACDVLVKLSSQENFPLPVIEMFASGGTVVVSSFHGHEHYIHHERNALVVPIDDAPAAVSAVKRLRDDRALLARLKEGAAGSIEGYSWENSNRVLEDRLLDLASKPGDGLDQLREMARYRPIFEDYQAACDEHRRLLRDVDWYGKSKSFRIGRCSTAPYRMAGRAVRGLRR